MQSDHQPVILCFKCAVWSSPAFFYTLSALKNIDGTIWRSRSVPSHWPFLTSKSKFQKAVLMKFPGNKTHRWRFLIFPHVAQFHKIPTLFPFTQDICRRWLEDPLPGANYMSSSFNIVKVNKMQDGPLWDSKKDNNPWQAESCFVQSSSLFNALGI